MAAVLHCRIENEAGDALTLLGRIHKVSGVGANDVKVADQSGVCVSWPRLS